MCSILKIALVASLVIVPISCHALTLEFWLDDPFPMVERPSSGSIVHKLNGTVVVTGDRGNGLSMGISRNSPTLEGSISEQLPTVLNPVFNEKKKFLQTITGSKVYKGGILDITISHDTPFGLY